MHFVDNVTWSYDSQFIYFNRRLRTGSDFHLYRVSVHEMHLPGGLF